MKAQGKNVKPSICYLCKEAVIWARLKVPGKKGGRAYKPVPVTKVAPGTGDVALTQSLFADGLAPEASRVANATEYRMHDDLCKALAGTRRSMDASRADRGGRHRSAGHIEVGFLVGVTTVFTWLGMTIVLCTILWLAGCSGPPLEGETDAVTIDDAGGAAEALAAYDAHTPPICEPQFYGEGDGTTISWCGLGAPGEAICWLTNRGGELAAQYRGCRFGRYTCVLSCSGGAR